MDLNPGNPGYLPPLPGPGPGDLGYLPPIPVPEPLRTHEDLADLMANDDQYNPDKLFCYICDIPRAIADKAKRLAHPIPQGGEGKEGGERRPKRRRRQEDADEEEEEEEEMPALENERGERQPPPSLLSAIDFASLQDLDSPVANIKKFRSFAAENPGMGVSKLVEEIHRYYEDWIRPLVGRRWSKWTIRHHFLAHEQHPDWIARDSIDIYTALIDAFTVQAIPMRGSVPSVSIANEIHKLMQARATMMKKKGK